MMASGSASIVPAGFNAERQPAGIADATVPSSSKREGIVTKAEACRLKYGIGTMRMDIWSLGPSILNRAISDKYMHALGRQIFDNEGFSRMRYQKVTVLEIDPNKASETHDHANTLAQRSGGRIAPPRKRELSSCLTKNHLTLWLQALASGQIAWDDDRQPMVLTQARVAQPELSDTLQNGVWVEKISYRAAIEDPEGVAAIIAADNLDQAFSLTEHEMELVRLYMSAVRSPTSATTTAWDAAREAVARKSSGNWALEDHVAAFNFAKETDPIRLQALRALHFHFVNPQALMIPVRYFELVRSIPTSYQWMRMALLAHAYQDDGHWVKAGGKIVSNGLIDKAIIALGKNTARLDQLEPLLENLLRTCVTGLQAFNSKPLSISAEETPYVRLKPALACLHRFGKMAMSGLDINDKPQKLAAIEFQMRKSLKLAHVELGAPQWHETVSLETTAGDKELQSKKKQDHGVQPMVAGVVSLEDCNISVR